MSMKSPRSFLALTFLLMATNTGNAYGETQEPTKDILDPIQMLQPGETHCGVLSRTMSSTQTLLQNTPSIMTGSERERSERVLNIALAILDHHNNAQGCGLERLDPAQIPELEPGETHCERLGQVMNDAYALRQNVSNTTTGEQQTRQEIIMRRTEMLFARHHLNACILGLDPPGQ